MTKEVEELVKALRWLAKVRVCETKIVNCHECEFHGYCEDPDSDESIAAQIVTHGKSADALESISAENKRLKKAISAYCHNDCFRDSCEGNEDVGIPDCPLAKYRPLPDPPQKESPPVTSCKTCDRTIDPDVCCGCYELAQSRKENEAWKD